MLEYMKFSIGCFFDGYISTEINVKDGMITASIENTLQSDLKQEKTLSFLKSQRWLSALDLIDLHKWKNAYIPVDMIFDGQQWEMDYQFENELPRHIYGDNAYPENWLEFLKLVKEITSNCVDKC